MAKLLRESIILFLCAAFSSVYSQPSQLTKWYKSIDSVSSSFRNNECAEVKKMILYNGRLVVIAHGSFSYTINDSCVTIPFLYHYGRISFEKSEYDKMLMLTSPQTELSILLELQLISIEEKKVDGPTSISFQGRRMWLENLYIESNNEMGTSTNLKSYWAIITIKDCYKVHFRDHLIGGGFYHIPYDGMKKRRMMNKLDRISKKQYDF